MGQMVKLCKRMLDNLAARGTETCSVPERPLHYMIRDTATGVLEELHVRDFELSSVAALCELFTSAVKDDAAALALLAQADIEAGLITIAHAIGNRRADTAATNAFELHGDICFNLAVWFGQRHIKYIEFATAVHAILVGMLKANMDKHNADFRHAHPFAKHRHEWMSWGRCVAYAISCRLRCHHCVEGRGCYVVWCYSDCVCRACFS